MPLIYTFFNARVSNFAQFEKNYQRWLISDLAAQNRSSVYIQTLIKAIEILENNYREGDERTVKYQEGLHLILNQV